MARKSVMELTVKEVIAGEDRAAVWFENRTPEGVIDTCDWLRVENDLIQEIRSFYDASKVREVLSDDERQRLDGGTGGRAED